MPPPVRAVDRPAPSHPGRVPSPGDGTRGLDAAVAPGRGHGQAAAMVAGLMVAASLLGFVRDLTIARYFGASAETDAFVVAWTIPETATPLLMEGAMAALLVPLFSHELARRGSFSSALNGLFLPLAGLLTALTALTAIGAPIVVDLLAPGIADRELAIRCVRLTSLTILFLGLSGYCMAALRAKNVFGWPAAVYIAYNVGIITTILLLHERLGVRSAALGLTIGAALMIVIQIVPFVRSVGLPRPTLRPPADLTGRLGVFVPLAAYTLARHGQVYVERIVGSTLSVGTLTHLNYATKVAQIPMLLALTLAMVTLPALSRSAAAGEHEQLRRLVERNLRLVGFLVLPATAFLIVLSFPIIGVLFERGAFRPADTDAAGAILRLYSLGLLGQVLVGVCLWAIAAVPGKTWRPARAASLGLLLTAALAVPAAAVLGGPGLALANAVGISLMAVLMVGSLRGRGIGVQRRALAGHFLRCATAALGAAAVGAGTVELGARLAGGEVADPVALLAGGAVIALGYVLLAALLGVEEARRLPAHARRIAGGQAGDGEGLPR